MGVPSTPDIAKIARSTPDTPKIVRDPVELVDIALGALVRRGTTLATLERAGERYELTLRRGARIQVALAADEEIAACAVARLALMAGLDPIAEAGTAEARANIARLRIGDGGEGADVLVSIALRGDAFDVELRAIEVQGAAVDAAVSALRRCPKCKTLIAAPESRCPNDGAILQDVKDDPRPGGTVGAYRIDGVLGRGGMGTVLEAVHVFLDRPVAIKVLHREIAPTAQHTQGFLAEARAASRVRDPRLIEVHDYGVLADGRPYVVMERLIGEPLNQYLGRMGALHPRPALRIAREIAVALAKAHAAGVVHNDLKPSNVMLLKGSTDAEPRLKLFDFGAASLLQSLQGGINPQREFMIGTPSYMSPEQIEGAPTDARSDVYSLGVVLYELLTDRVPFEGDVPTVLRAHLHDPPPVVTSTHGVLPHAVTRLVARALAKSPAERHQSAEELVADLGRAGGAVEGPAWMRWLR